VTAERNLVLESAPSTVIADTLKLQESALERMRTSRQIVGFLYQTHWMFPLWQFDTSLPTKIVPHLDEILSALESRSNDEIIDWLRTPKNRLDGASPIEALKSGEHIKVLELARAMGAS
jgi:hypothetical protein